MAGEESKYAETVLPVFLRSQLPILVWRISEVRSHSDITIHKGERLVVEDAYRYEVLAATATTIADSDERRWAEMLTHRQW